jgi:hypothetical protein
MTDSRRFSDSAEPILRGEPTLNDEQRANLWEVFHSARTSQELIPLLHGHAIPEELKQRLFEAKQLSDPEPDRAAHIFRSIRQVVQMDPKLRTLAEKHSHLLNHFIADASGKKGKE